jgi:hypothetical protein
MRFYLTKPPSSSRSKPKRLKGHFSASKQIHSAKISATMAMTFTIEATKSTSTDYVKVAIHLKPAKALPIPRSQEPYV